jgi:hypothetical protein
MKQLSGQTNSAVVWTHTGPLAANLSRGMNEAFEPVAMDRRPLGVLEKRPLSNVAAAESIQ